MSAFTKLLKRGRSQASRKRVVSRSAFCDEGGVSQFEWLGDEEVHHRVLWDQIETVIAYQVDRYAFWDVAVVLLDGRGEVLASVSEDSGSFGRFITLMPKWLIGCKPPNEWWDQVDRPEYNQTVIYQRAHPPTGG